jgi:hypothetical protein
VRLYVWAAIQAGTTMHWGAHAADRLDAGNVWSPGAAPPGPTPPAGTLWVDLSCDVVQLSTRLGGAAGDRNLITKAEAATAEVILVDPDRIYDPLNPDGPYQYGGRTRLGPGVALLVFTEVQTGPTTVTQTKLFTGTVDTWAAPWTRHANERRVRVVASDATKILAGLDWGEQSPAGAGDTTDARITRILTYYASTLAKRLDASPIALQATTLAQSAWELISRVSDDEIGFIYIDPTGTLQFHARTTWATTPAPVLTVGCSPEVPVAKDIVIDAEVDSNSLSLTNSVTAARTGGTAVTSRSSSSITLYGERGYKRTDLGLNSDPLVAQWASYMLGLHAFPRARLTAVQLVPHFDDTSWPAVLGIRLALDRVRVLWTPPDATVAYDTTARVFGVSHRITRTSWQTTWELAYADLFSRVMHWGAHPFDRLNVGNVYR